MGLADGTCLRLAKRWSDDDIVDVAVRFLKLSGRQPMGMNGEIYNQWPERFRQGPTTFSKLGVQFLGLCYYYPSTEKDRSTQFGAVGYIITLYSSKSYVKSWGSVQILGRSGTPTPQWLRLQNARLKSRLAVDYTGR